MKTWVLGVLNLAFFSVTATAGVPHASLNQLVQQADPNCRQTASNGLADLIHEIASTTNTPTPQAGDPRKSGGLAAGLNVDESKRADETTGYVMCPGTKYGNGSMGSGALVGPGNQVLTSAHLFIDDNGIPREPLSECFFQNQANPPQRRALNFTTKDLYKLFTAYPKGDKERDLALIRIVETNTPITKLKPFPVRFSREALPKDVPLTMISASHLDLDKNPKFPQNKPIVQVCKWRDKFRVASGGRRTDGIFSDCVAAPGASGSIQMVRDESGQLTIAGVATTSKKTPSCEYDLQTTCQTFGTEITPAIAAEINEFQLANANTRSSTQEASNRGL